MHQLFFRMHSIFDIYFTIYFQLIFFIAVSTTPIWLISKRRINRLAAQLAAAAIIIKQRFHFHWKIPSFQHSMNRHGTINRKLFTHHHPYHVRAERKIHCIFTLAVFLLNVCSGWVFHFFDTEIAMDRFVPHETAEHFIEKNNRNRVKFSSSSIKECKFTLLWMESVCLYNS